MAEDHTSFLIGVVIAEQPQYIQIDSVHSASRAERAGLRAGDIIQQLNGQPIRTVAEFNARKIQLVRERQTLEVIFSRGGRSYRTQIPVE